MMTHGGNDQVSDMVSHPFRPFISQCVDFWIENQTTKNP